jgi:hypothetical protein
MIVVTVLGYRHTPYRPPWGDGCSGMPVQLLPLASQVLSKVDLPTGSDVSRIQVTAGETAH